MGTGNVLPQSADDVLVKTNVVVTAEARILRADNGSEVSPSMLAETGEKPTGWSFDGRGRMTSSAIVGVNPAGDREALSLRLASGRTVEAVTDINVTVLQGIKPLREIEVGDRIAVPRRMPEPLRTRSMVDDEVVLLAHMIGDGSCVKNQPIRYASVDEVSLAAVTKAARYFGVTAKRDDYAAARVTTLRLPAPYHLTHGVRNPIAEWLDGHGLFGKRSYDKFVPDAVFSAPKDQVALFLRHLWATDGCVVWDGKQRQGRIYYGSTSFRLIEDVRKLLLRFGIATRAYCTPKAGYRDYWFLNIYGVGNQKRFLQQIDVHGVKFFACREVRLNLESVSANENVDTIPKEVWDTVRESLKVQKMTHRAFADAMQTKFCGSTMWKHSPSRSRLHRAAVILDDRGLHDLTKNDVFWDKVVEITPIGERESYRVEVEGADNVVVNGISVWAG